ncbi:hypothetical protein CRG98_036321 [Punica granatum]|uniref:Uncharacterized protein n=1 Tax=Punica granatum TaxID=22663 RepID=A0A2I0IGU8_PUNGR|nr:hypothetical protein CRG98_036321 [Punica granatum]
MWFREWKAKWIKQPYQDLSKQNSENRALSAGGCVHTGGSISIGTHIMKMLHQKQKECCIWVDPRSANTHGDYVKEVSSSVESRERDENVETPSPGTNESHDDMWIQVAGGPNKKGRVYGMSYSLASSQPPFPSNMPRPPFPMNLLQPPFPLSRLSMPSFPTPRFDGNALGSDVYRPDMSGCVNNETHDQQRQDDHTDDTE